MLCTLPGAALTSAPPQNRQNECPWAQDTDAQQFKRGPPSRDVRSPGNPINHTGYGVEAPTRLSKKPSGKAIAGVPWAQDQEDSYSKPSNAIGAGLGAGLAIRNGGAAPSARSNNAPQMAPPQQQQYYAEPIGDDGEYYDENGRDPREIAYMQEMMQRQQQCEDDEQYSNMPPPQQQQQQPRGAPSKAASDAGCPWAQVYNQPLMTESRAQFQGSQILRQRDGAPQHKQQPKRGGGPPADENYNLLHDGHGVEAPTRSRSTFEREQQAAQQREAIFSHGQQANMDSRRAAQAIKDRMRFNNNVISWE